MAVVGKNPIAEGNFHGFLPVTVKALNSYSKSFTSGDRTKAKIPAATEVSRIAELLLSTRDILRDILLIRLPVNLPKWE